MTRLLLAAVTAAVLAGPAPADFPFGLFKKKPKAEATPAKAKQFAATLATSPDEAARKQAAEELRALDPRSNAEVFPALIGALQKDPSPAVRVAAADSVGRLKPVYQPAGMVLETVAQTDPDPTVREAAKDALFQYHLGGYVTPAGPKGATSAEPPFAQAKSAVPGLLTFRPITNTPPGKGAFYPPTPEPPLAKKLLPPAGKPATTTPASLPAGVPQPMPSVLPPPAPTPQPATTTPSVPTGPLPPISVPPPPTDGK